MRQTQNAFAKHGARTLLFAKFFPGLNTVAPPMAGMIGMPLPASCSGTPREHCSGRARSSSSDSCFPTRSSSWRSTRAAWAGGSSSSSLSCSRPGSLWKYVQRRRFIRSLRVARITPEELKRRIDAGEDVVIVDLRGSLDFEIEPRRLPGARRFSAEALQARHLEIPRDREVVLYCT